MSIELDTCDLFGNGPEPEKVKRGDSCASLDDVQLLIEAIDNTRKRINGNVNGYIFELKPGYVQVSHKDVEWTLFGDNVIERRVMRLYVDGNGTVEMEHHGKNSLFKIVEEEVENVGLKIKKYATR